MVRSAQCAFASETRTKFVVRASRVEGGRGGEAHQASYSSKAATVTSKASMAHRRPIIGDARLQRVAARAIAGKPRYQRVIEL